MTTHFESINDINSSVIEKISYDKLFCHLFITFKNGGVYRYLAVPGYIFDAFNTAIRNDESVGKLFNERIKDMFLYDKI